MKWLMILALLGITSQKVAASGDMTASVFSTTSKTMVIRWTRYPGAESYKITASPKNSPNSPSAFAQYSANTVMGSVTSLSPNTVYEIDVEAMDSSQVTLCNVTVESITAPEMMDPIQAVKPKDSTTLMVEFNEVHGATHYIVRSEDSQGHISETQVSSSPGEIRSLQPYTDYTLTVMAVNSGGRTQPPSPVDAKTVLPPPQLTTSSPTNDSIVVSWITVNDAVSYSLVVHKFGSYSNMMVNTTDTNMTVTGLDAGSLYVIKVYAWDMEGRKGEASLYTNQTTRPQTPGPVNVTVVKGHNVAMLSVSWDTDSDAYGANQYLVTSDRNLQCNTTTNTCSLSPVSCGEIHAIQVVGSNDAGPSYPSHPLVFVTFPCPPEPLAVTEDEPGVCTLSWSAVAHADEYVAFIKRNDGGEEACNVTGHSCHYRCECGYTYLTSILAFNQAGSSDPGPGLNYTTLPCCPADVSITAETTDSIEITWTAARGADLYETRAVSTLEVVVCNDTAPVCVLSDLRCDSPYSVLVTPCSEIAGCNRACQPHIKETAPCTPVDLMVEQKNESMTVSWTAHNRAATYTVTAAGTDGTHSCSTASNSCDLANLPCGSTYEVIATASSAAGQSLPSFSVPLETAPCCPANLTVDQVTQAMTNVTWSHARGADLFITSLTSSRGHARCHTQDSHCLMGCITCGTHYTVSMEAFSRTGHRSNCSYKGFSSSACCPSGVKLYRMASSVLRVYWRSSGSNHNYTAEMIGSSTNYTCSPAAGESSCDLADIQCGEVYNIVVAPVSLAGDKVQFCPHKLYSVTCSGSNVGMVLYRGKRSVV